MSVFDDIQTAMKDADTKRTNLAKAQDEANVTIKAAQDKVNKAAQESNDAQEKVRVLRVELDKQLDESAGPRNSNVKQYG